MNARLCVRPSTMGLFGADSRDQKLRLVTFGLFGASAADVPRDFVWDAPLDAADRAAGGVCSATGYRAPGHSMVTVGGRRYIAEFAPKGGKP